MFGSYPCTDRYRNDRYTRSCILRRSPPRQTAATATAVLARAALCSGLRRRAQSDRSIRRGQQQQEERPVSFVIGCGSAAFRALHDHVSFGCTDTPVPFSAAPLQDHFKDWKPTIRHGNRDKRTSAGKHHTNGRWECHRILRWNGGKPRWATCLAVKVSEQRPISRPKPWDS
jgi:hypothetical protein